MRDKQKAVVNNQITPIDLKANAFTAKAIINSDREKLLKQFERRARLTQSRDISYKIDASREA